MRRLASLSSPSRELQSAMYDVLVIGGGPAGTTAAALLAESGLHTLLVERETENSHNNKKNLLQLENDGLYQLVEVLLPAPMLK